MSFNISIAFTTGLLYPFPKYLATMAHIKHESNKTILIHIGSILSHAEHCSKRAETALLLDAMGFVGYQVSTVSYHDIEYFEVNQMLTNPFPIISKNVYYHGIKSSAIIEVEDNVKIGFISYTDIPNLNISDLILHLIDEAVCLRKEVSVVVLLSHTKHEDVDQEIAQGVRGYVDMIFGGGSHTISHCNHTWHTGDDIIIHTGSGLHNHIGLVNIRGYSNSSISVRSELIHPEKFRYHDHKRIEYVSLLEKKRKECTTNQNKVLVNNFPLVDNKTCYGEECVTGGIILQALVEYFDCNTAIYIEDSLIRSYFTSTITEQNLQEVLWLNKTAKFIKMSWSVSKKGNRFGNYNGYWNQNHLHLHHSSSSTLPSLKSLIQKSKCYDKSKYWDVDKIMEYNQQEIPESFHLYVSEHIFYRDYLFFTKHGNYEDNHIDANDTSVKVSLIDIVRDFLIKNDFKSQ
jgi:hypothetical protein